MGRRTRVEVNEGDKEMGENHGWLSEVLCLRSECEQSQIGLDAHCHFLLHL